MAYHLGDGRWWDAEAGRWRDGRGRQIQIRSGGDILGRARRTRVVLAAAHCDHNTSNNADANLAAFCQRCHMIHDRPEHQRRRWRILFRRKALGDLFGGLTGKLPEQRTAIRILNVLHGSPQVDGGRGDGAAFVVMSRQGRAGWLTDR